MPFTPPEWRIDVVGRRRICTKGLRHQSTLGGDRSMHCSCCARLSGDQCGELRVLLGTADAEVLTMLFLLVPVRPYDLRPTTVWPGIGMRPCLRHPNAQNINVGVVSLVAFTGSGADTMCGCMDCTIWREGVRICSAIACALHLCSCVQSRSLAD